MALLLAQKHGVAEDFALKVLSLHNEKLQNPNSMPLLQEVLTGLGVPEEEVTAVITDPNKAARNAQERDRADAMLTGGGVPQFFVRVGGGKDLCEEVNDSPTSPQFFERIFERICSRSV